MKKIDFTSINIGNGFWKQKQDMVRDVTVDAVYDRFVETLRFDALKCKWREGDKGMPHIFWDSDVAKWIEGVAYLLTKKRDERLERIVDDAVAEIIENSDENGYFNSHYLVTERDKRFTDRNCHELYCAGHLIEAAIAYKNATGKSEFLSAMCKYADYIERIFMIEKSASFTTPGHPELELALVKLFDETGEKRYLELAKYFIDMHGVADEPYILDDITHNQDDMPLRHRSEAKGHCVRALYLYCAMADIAQKYDDAELLDACKRVFDDIAQRKVYVTGGIGSTPIGEKFTVPYHLPNKTAYSETCAAISLAMFCERMQALHIDSKYADMAERAIYNAVLSGVSLDGKSFFYVNPLEIDPRFNGKWYNAERLPITERVEVFDCSCCPPNIVRFIPHIAEMMYTYDDETIYIHHYIDSDAECDGIKISQRTLYPTCGKVSICCKAPQSRIAVRIPAWCKSFKLNADYIFENGYAYIELNGETELELEFDMPVSFLRADRRVHENAGRIAVMRGPIVYCAEAIDNGEDLRSIRLDTSKRTEVRDDPYLLLPRISLSAKKPRIGNSLYDTQIDDDEQTTLELIPYNAFANRGESEMLVWLTRG